MIIDASEADILLINRRRRGVEKQLCQIRLDEPVGPVASQALQQHKTTELVLLRLPIDVVLERIVLFPFLADRDIKGALSYEMERLTPLSAEQAYWSWKIVKRDRKRSRLTLQLTLIPKNAVAHLIELLASLGSRPLLIEAPTLSGVSRIELSHDHNDNPSLRGYNKIIAAAVAALTVIAALLPFLLQTLELHELQNKIDMMAPALRKSELLHKQFLSITQSNEAYAAEARRLGDALDTLSAITTVLPNDSYLTEFVMKERRVTLSGFSASAPKLISLLSFNAFIRNPSFAAPITKTDRNHLDVFSIQAETVN